MSWKTLELERSESVLRVWLARPERRNALDTQTLEEIIQLFSSLQEDFETRVVILAGRGPSFCAGADRKNPPGSALMSASSGTGERERR
ncbi:MAG: enoyl-CoA hydratase-related protein, partial [Myxococcota bacterium]